MTRTLLSLLALLLALPAAAQWHIDPGAAIGMQSYESSADDPRVLSELEVLVRKKAWGAHLAVEYADLSFAGRIFVGHFDAAYRQQLPREFSFLVATGPTIVSSESGRTESTFNVAVELARRFGRTDVFVRARQYDFTLDTFRDITGPSGPAIQLGARFALRR